MKPRAFPWVALVILGLGAPFLKAGSTAIFTDQAQSTGNTFTTAASFPIALVQKNYGAAYLTTSVSATFDATPVANHLLVAILGASTTSTINQPAGWSTAINQSGGSCTQPCQAIFYRIAGSGESRTVTVTVSDSNSVLGLQIYEYSGIDTSSPLDQTNSSTGTSTSPSSGSATTTQPNELLIVGMVIRTATSYSDWTNSFNEQFDFQFEVGQTYVRTYAGADRVVTATGTYSTTATTAASGAWRGQIATFKNSGDYGGAHRAAPATSTQTPSTTPTPTPTGTPSPIATPTFTVIPSPTATPTPTPAAMLSPTATPTTPAAMPSPTATPTLTLAVTPSPTATPTPTPAAMPSPAATATSAVTPSSKATPSPELTATPSPTPTPTPSCAAGDTGFLNPSAEAADPGDGNGFEVDPTNAFADGGDYASNMDGAGDRHRYYDYAISIPSGCSVKGIEVRLDWWLDSTEGTSSMSVELSWDGGTSWTAAKTDTEETTSEHTATLGSWTDTWGRSWTAEDLSDANFRVRLTSNSSDSLRDFYLDWVPVKVYDGP